MYAVLRFVFTLTFGFAFGFGLIGKLFFFVSIATRLLLGIFCAIIITMIQLYFLMKRTNKTIDYKSLYMKRRNYISNLYRSYFFGGNNLIF